MVEGLFQPMHLVLILVLVLIFLGPGKLTDLGSSLGQGMRELRRSMADPDADAAGPGSGAAPAPDDVSQSSN